MGNQFGTLDLPVGLQAHQFSVKSYGARGDGATDDTAAINLAVSAAYNWGVANGTYYAEVVFPPATYLVSAAATQGGSTKGNAQIPLPVPAVTAQKFTLVLTGMVDAAALWHWQQTTVQTGGVTIKSTLVGTNDVTYGAASVVGGPTPEQGYGQAAALFSNMLIVVNGIRIVVPNDPHVCGFDFRGIAEASVISGACMANAVPGTVSACGQTWQFGLAMPENNNNDYCRIGNWSAEGMNYGLYADEHTVAESIRGIYCIACVECGQGNSDTSHGMLLGYVSSEACQVGIGAADGGSPIKVKVELLDHESGSGSFTPFAAINDPTDKMLGDIWVTGTSTQLISEGTGAYNVNGGHALNVYDTRRQTGTATAPGVPATTVALRNPFWRNAAVHVVGGTVTVIAVDGVATGVTSGLVIVPTGRTIALTYSVAPTWKWTLL